MKFTLKQAVETGIEMGMTEFIIYHHSFGNIRKVIFNKEDVLKNIEAYKDCIPMTVYYGTYYHETIPEENYSKPTLCAIEYRLVDETLHTK